MACHTKGDRLMIDGEHFRDVSGHPSRWAPDPVINGVMTPINGLINGLSWGYFTLLIGVIAPVITGRGPPCCCGDDFRVFLSSKLPTLVSKFIQCIELQPDWNKNRIWNDQSNWDLLFPTTMISNIILWHCQKNRKQTNKQTISVSVSPSTWSQTKPWTTFFPGYSTNPPGPRTPPNK